MQQGHVGVALLRFWRWGFGYDFLGFFYKLMLLRNGTATTMPIYSGFILGGRLRVKVGTADGHVTVGDKQSAFCPGLT